MLKRGANVNVEDQNGLTPLMTAVADGSLPYTKLLIDSGARINVQHPSGKILMHCAQLKGNKKIEALLKQHMANQ